MKMIRIILFAFLSIASFSACGHSNGNDVTTPTVTDKLSLTTSNVQADAAGGDFSVTVNATRGEWTAYSESSWVTVSNANTGSVSGTITLKVAANTSSESRTGSVVVKSGSARSSITVEQAGRPTADMTIPEGYKLVWNDEFDGTELGSDWTYQIAKPSWVNNELQEYVRNDKVVFLKDGKLNIRCYQDAEGHIYSGRIYAKETEGWTYGYFEASIKLPQGKGTWPAWWMMPANNDYSANPWPGCGEIDIMEEVGVDANQVSSTIHCTKYNNTNTAIEHYSMFLPTAESDYHVYACEWTPEYISFLVDGEEKLRYTNDHSGKAQWPFDVPFYPILNLAWGGDWGGYNGVDNTALPVTMSVDYVRIFQKK